MKFDSFLYYVKSEVTFTAEEAEILVYLAQNHYDATCRAAGLSIPDGAKENGFLAQLVMFAQPLHSVIWDFSKFDFTMKVLEGRSAWLVDHRQEVIADRLAWEIRDVMKNMGDRYEALNKGE